MRSLRRYLNSDARMNEIELTLCTCRTISQGLFMEFHGKYSREYVIELSTIRLSIVDAAKLGVKDGDVVEVEGPTGRKVKLLVKIDPNIPEGVAYVPYGHVINTIVPSETEACATPNYKQIRVRVRKMSASESDIEKLVEEHAGESFLKSVPGIGERPLAEGELRIVRDVVCPFCGLLCDNLVVKLSGDRVVDVQGACVIGRAKFVTYHKERVLRPLKRTETGKFIEVDLERAIDEVVDLLAKSKYPLFYGWSCTTCEAIRLGLRIAELVGGVVDNTSSVCHGPTLMAVAETGHSDFTLGFTTHYADMILIWGWNPAHAHPNFMYRFVNRTGKLGYCRKDRKVIIIDVRNVSPVRPSDIDIRKCTGCDLCTDFCPEVIRKVTSAKAGKARLRLTLYIVDFQKCRECGLCIEICPARAIQFIRDVDDILVVEPGKDYELLTALRMCLRDLEIEKSRIAGVPRGKVVELCEELRKSKYVVLFFGVGLTHSHGKFKNIEEAIKLIHDLNEHTKAIIIAMRGHFNVTGANMVFLWTYGAPFGIDLSRRYPRYIPGVTSAVDILRRKEADFMLVAGADPASSFPREAIEHMHNIPVVLLTPKLCRTMEYADIVIPVALTGIEAEGTAYRLDAIPIRLRKIVDPPEGVLPDEKILEIIYEKLRKILRK